MLIWEAGDIQDAETKDLVSATHFFLTWWGWKYMSLAFYRPGTAWWRVTIEFGPLEFGIR